MNILLVDVDSVIPNIALEKLRLYYTKKGSKVTMIKDGLTLPFIVKYDRIYVSCVFAFNSYRCKKWECLSNDVHNVSIGGSGYSVTKKLPDAIENVKPKINYGFTSRGCVRDCEWCIVQEKEGKCRVTGDIYDFWDGEAKEIAILDNNILGMPKQFYKLCEQLKKEKLHVDFNSGFDHRLLTPKIIDYMMGLDNVAMGVGGKKGRTGRLRLAFDHISQKRTVLKALKLLKKYGMSDWSNKPTRWYIYVGAYDTVDTVLTRINIIRDAGQLCFVMLDRDPIVQNNREFKALYSYSTSVPVYTQSSYPPKKLIKDNRPKLFDKV